MSAKTSVTIVPESHFLEGMQNNDLFLKLLNHKQIAMALTDDHGNVILSNNLFLKKVLQSPNRPDFKLIIKKSESDHLLSDDEQIVRFNNGEKTIELAFLKLIDKVEGAGYIWFVSENSDSSVDQKMIAMRSVYESLLNTSFQLLFRTSLEGEIIFGNKVFLEVFNLDKTEKNRENYIEELFEVPEQFKIFQQRVIQEKKLENEVVFFKRHDGKRLTGRVNCHLNNDESGMLIMNWAMLDISIQTESEEVLQSKNDELAKVNTQMEKFLYSTSHDLRSPITSILGLVNLVRMESKEAVVLDYVSKIESSTQKLDKIIRDIMSFSRATYKRTSTDKVNFEILAWKAFNAYRHDPNSKKIHFEVKTTATEPFYSDSEKLDIIFENIVRNAIQFYDPNKSRPFIQVNITPTRSHTLIEFIDNGLGIAKQHIDQVFNMFYKATHLSRGAGLGLYIVKETVEKIGSTVQLESEIGFGTVVRLTVPNDLKGKLIDRKIQLKHQA